MAKLTYDKKAWKHMCCMTKKGLVINAVAGVAYMGIYKVRNPKVRKALSFVAYIGAMLAFSTKIEN